MMWITFLVILGTSCALGLPRADDNSKDWYKTASIYQIYPRSYKDSDGDGIGDLKGITSKLDHLKDAGIDATWLSPIFKSPMADFGYDISDFYSIQPEYGSMADFEELTKKADELGIKIVLDFVPNHSSDECDWFRKSADPKDPEHAKYKDYYVWHNGLKDAEGKRLPPNNWVCGFRGSAWTWNEKRQAYYLHQFLDKQPDLNYRNPAVVTEMQEVLKFWMGKGAAGFRVDAVPNLFEIKADKDGNYLNEPLSGKTDDKDDPSYLYHIYTQDQDDTYGLIYGWRKVLDNFAENAEKKYTRIMMTEAYTDIERTMRYFGNGTDKGSHIPFNFYLIFKLDTTSTSKDYVKWINEWINNVPEGFSNNWVLGNHDQKRIPTRFGEKRIDHMTMLLRLLPGIGITYQGDEIGMKDVHVSWEETVDPLACMNNSTLYEDYSRDPGRTPFQWDATTSAGFSNNPKPWLPVAPDYKEYNLEKQIPDSQSHYGIFKSMSKLRKTPTIQQGALNLKAIGDNVVAFTRTLKDEDTYLVLLNLADKEDTLKLQDQFEGLPSKMKVYTSNQRKSDEEVDTSSVVVKASEAIVLQGRSGASVPQISFVLLLTTMFGILRNIM